MKRWILRLYALSVLFLLPCAVQAEVSVELKLDRKEATLEDSIRLIVGISGKHDGRSALRFHGLKDFKVTDGGTAKRVEIVNGKVNSRIEYTYFIQADKTGVFRIGPTEVKYKGRSFFSNTETLAIVKSVSKNDSDRGTLFMTSSLSSAKAYVEEQLIFKIRLYRQEKISDVSLDLPDAEGLVFKQLGKPVEYRSTLKGQVYHVLEVRYSLIPSRKGDYLIPPSRMHMNVFRSERRSFQGMFNDPFFSNAKPITLAGESLSLKVIPLPETGRPPDFSGLVGSFEIKSTLKPSEISLGESATLTISLNGRGNIDRFPALKCPELEHNKVYADQPVLKVESDSQGMAGMKVMKWAIVPEKEGSYQLPPLSVYFFDTGSHEYRAIKTTPHILKVLPSEQNQMMVHMDPVKEKDIARVVKKEVKELGHDILPVHTSIKAMTTRTGVRYQTVFFWMALLLPPLLYIITLLSFNIKKRSAQSLLTAKAKKAAKNFIKKYRNKRSTPAGLSLAFNRYLNDRFFLSCGSVTPDEAVEILKSKGVGTDTTDELRAVLKQLEVSIYSGNEQELCDKGKDILRIIKQIEKEVR